MRLEILKNYKHDGKIYALLLKNNILYVGDSNKNFIDFFKKKCLFSFKKSVRSIISYENYILVGSYDCTAALFKDEKFEELIEGPETEIKGCAMNDDYIVLATRGCTLWIATYAYDIETVLEDHTQDIKGCAFFQNQLVSWSYDNSIKVYEKLEGIDESFSLVNNIELTHTIWNILFIDDHYVVFTDNGEVLILNNKYKIIRQKVLSRFPIYASCKINNFYAISHNLHNIAIYDLEFNLCALKENIMVGINSIVFDGTNKIFAGGDCSTISEINILI